MNLLVGRSVGVVYYHEAHYGRTIGAIEVGVYLQGRECLGIMENFMA